MRFVNAPVRFRQGAHLGERLTQARAEGGDDVVEVGVVGVHRDPHAVEEA